MSSTSVKRIGLLSILLASLQASSQVQTTIHVDDDASLGGDGTSWSSAFKHLQDALAVASPGDGIRVAGGTYKPDQDEAGHVTAGDREARFRLKGGVSLYGGYRGCPKGGCTPNDPNERDIQTFRTTLSGDLAGNDGPPPNQNDEENSYRVVSCRGFFSPILIDGFTISGGNANRLLPPDRFGGGMYNDGCFALLVKDCTFTHNSACEGGGGIYNLYGTLTVIGCTFGDNWAGSDGGAVYNSNANATVAKCTFAGNSAAGSGGALYNRGSIVTVDSCTFDRNVSYLSGGGMHSTVSIVTVTWSSFRNNSGPSSGGGMYNHDSDLTVRHCVFVGNWAEDAGGAMYNWSGSPTVAHCLFAINSASGYGGGISAFQSSQTVTSSVFVGNAAGLGGGGMRNTLCEEQKVSNCAFIANSSEGRGGGVWTAHSAPVSNCILWDNTSAEYPQVCNRYAGPAVIYSCVQGGYSGEGNVDAGPLIVRVPDHGGDGWGDDWTTPHIDEGANDDYGDLRIRSGSPCINTGDPAFLPEPGETDLDGHARVLCGRVDMGAYEFGIGDYNCNQVVDLSDFASWEGCMAGPFGDAYDLGCEAFDFEFDGDIDLVDGSAFQTQFAPLARRR